ncbi:MAG: DUF4149 domain-containing protein [Pseudomonadota bacterium]
MTETALLLTAFLFGGMALFSFGFAAFLFSALPSETASPLIRRAFPHFYLFVLITACVALLPTIARDLVSTYILAAIALTTVFARQILMPAINKATDAGDKRRFAWLHGFSVLITLCHIVAAGVVLVRLSNI